MPQKIEVLQVVNKAGVSKQGRPFSMDIAQCVLHEKDGTRTVGELLFPKGVMVPAGYYSAALHLVRSMDGKLLGAVKSLAPWVEPPKVRAA